MKTVCKKLFSLMLVAALLVSAIPAAFAAGATCPTCGSTGTLYAGSNGVTSSSSKLATCKEEGTDVYACNNKDCGAYFGVTVPKKEHTYVKNEAESVAATCTTDGKNVFVCSVDGCLTVKEEVVKAAGNHTFGAATQTKAPTCTAEGENSYTCTSCGFGKTEPIARLSHTYGADGKCACGATDGVARYNVSFDVDNNGTPEEVIVFANGQTVTSAMLPDAPLKDGKQFIGWYSGTSKLENLLQNGTWHAGMPTYFYANYVDSDDDGVSKLYVYVRFYVKGVQQGYTQLLIDPVQFKDGENMFNWLQNNKGTIGAAIEAKDTENKYQWYPEYFYNYSGDEILTAQTLKSNGDQSVVVKAYAEKAAEANVMIYVHTSKTSTPAAIYELDGKTAGNTVTLAEVKTLLKNKYTVTEGLYSDKAWTDMLNKLNPMPVNGIDVADNGTLKIHVLAKAGSSNADSSNPKTGDYITITATAMVLSAAAFVAMVEMKKRKMI